MLFDAVLFMLPATETLDMRLRTTEDGSLRLETGVGEGRVGQGMEEGRVGQEMEEGRGEGSEEGRQDDPDIMFAREVCCCIMEEGAVPTEAILCIIRGIAVTLGGAGVDLTPPGLM